LPKRIELIKQERCRLVRHGKKLGARIKELISIVSYSTFRKWVRNVEDSPPIHIGTPGIWVSPCTANPTGEWTTQQASNFDIFQQDENLPCTILQRDQDTKYVQAFDDVFTGVGRAIKKTPIQSPNLQAFGTRLTKVVISRRYRFRSDG
jgi:hypothetical protein